MPPFWRRKRRQKTSGIPKLTGSPFTNVPRWLYERTKRIKTNPLKPGESTKTKDKKINIPNLQKTLMKFTSTINKLIDEINKIPPLEAKWAALESKHKKDMAASAADLLTHADKGTGAYGGTHSTGTGGSSSGSTSYEEGGSVDEKEKQKLIDNILKKLDGK